MKFEFKDFLLNENRAHLGQRMSDILNSLQELEENGKSLGTRQMVKDSEGVVNQLRRILHTHWGKEEEKHLKPLQKVGVALMKAIEEKSNLPDAITGSTREMEKLMTDMKVPVNKLAAPEGAERPKESGEGEVGVAGPQGEAPEQPPEQPQQPPGAPGTPPAAAGAMPVPGAMPPPPGMPGMPGAI